VTRASRECWDAWNFEQSAGAHNQDRRMLTARVVSEFIGLVPGGASVLDVGIGAGWTTRQLCTSYNYLGLDVSEAGVRIAKRDNPGARLIAADFLEWQAPAHHFDAVLCVDTIAYFEDQALAVAKMAKALKPGGWLVISTINPFVYSRFKWIQERNEPRMGKWLERDQLERMLTVHGFDVRRSFTVVPAGDQGWLRVLNSRRFKELLGERYVRLLEDFGLGQNRVAIARKL
jgi:SAM-dependent methyltransferase